MHTKPDNSKSARRQDLTLPSAGTQSIIALNSRLRVAGGKLIFVQSGGFCFVCVLIFQTEEGNASSLCAKSPHGASGQK
jgi:hypothetical protein